MDTTTDDAHTASRIDTLLAHYSESHRHPINEAIHCVAVPLIMFSLVGLIHALRSEAAFVFLLASLVYYLRLSWRAAALMSVWTVALLALVISLGERQVWVCSLVFVLAWVAQFVGHQLEGKKPSFFEDIQYLWIGPLFVAQTLLRRTAWHW